MTEHLPPANLKRTVVRGVTVATVGVFLKQALTLVVYIALARLAPPTTFGTFAAASVLVWFGALFVESGMAAALIHREDRIEEAANTAFVSTLAGGLVISGLCAALAPIVGLYFGSHQITILAAAVAGLHLLNSAAVVPEALLRRRFSFVRRAIVDPITIIAFGTTAAVGLTHGLGVWALALAAYASDVVRVILDWTFCGWRPRIRRASWSMWRELAGYARHVLLGELFRQSGGIFNTAVIGRFVGRADLAQYNFGYRLATETSTPMTAVSFMLFPALSRISSDQQRFGNAALQSFRSASFIAFPLSFILVPLGEPLVVLLLGERWRAAGVVVTGLAAVGAALSLRAVSVEVLKASGHPEQLPRIYGLSTALPAVAVLTGLPFGLAAIACGVSVAFAAVAVYAALRAAGVAGIATPALVRAVVPPALASATMALVLYPLEHLAIHSDHRGITLGLSLLGAEVVLGAAIYLAVVSLVDPKIVREFSIGVRDAWKRRTAAGAAATSAEAAAVPPTSG